FQHQLGPCQSYHLYHGAGREIGTQDFSSRFVYVAMITDIGGEDIHRHHIVEGSTGGLDGALNFADDIPGLGASITGPNNITFSIRSRLTSDKNHTTRLRNGHWRITAARHRKSFGIESCLRHRIIPLSLCSHQNLEALNGG